MATMSTPKAMMMTPAIRSNVPRLRVSTFPRLAAATPNTANTTVNPAMKRRMTRTILGVDTLPSSSSLAE
jgi:hypothetical protein